MKPLPQFVFIAPSKTAPEGQSMGAGFILETVPPFFVGRIIKLPADNYKFALLQYRNRFKPLLFEEVPGHSILIAYEGSLIPTQDGEQTVRPVFNGMANFFLEEKVNNSGFYKRFLLEN